MTNTTLLKDTQENRVPPGRADRLRNKVVVANPGERFVERYYLLEEAYRRHQDQPYAVRHAHIT